MPQHRMCRGSFPDRLCPPLRWEPGGPLHTVDLTRPTNLSLLPENSSFDLSLTPPPPPYSAGGRHMLLPTVMVGCVLPAVRIHWTMAPAASNHRPVAADCVFLQSADKKLHTHTHFCICLTPPWRRTLRTKSSHSPTAKLPIIFAVLPWPASASSLVRPIANTRATFALLVMIMIAALVSLSV